ncbi:hypothetical protein NC653_010028 [Populus alba x Populus x berolinensis]|uniref:Uncharacterized protein n=1 Tax=Populus alba x Populus x berolinensis TaxID=444605 RepID=A0AAD6WAF2_9ROSI|nr:hypothetical protein NC653_010028 [Populus alba x Populus x berolinensis]
MSQTQLWVKLDQFSFFHKVAGACVLFQQLCALSDKYKPFRQGDEPEGPIQCLVTLPVVPIEEISKTFNAR